ncbi:MAG: hypothetical protein WCH01_05795 [Methylococcaceae bacterium]
MRDVVGRSGFRSNHQKQSLTGRDGVTDFLEELELSRGHRDAVESTRCEIIIELADKRFVIAAGV